MLCWDITRSSLLLLALPLLNALQMYTNHFRVHLKQPGVENAHRVAKRNGFVIRKDVLGSEHEFHFVQPALSHARTKRSVGHHAKLCNDDDVAHVHQLLIYKTLTKGYRPLEKYLQSVRDQVLYPTVKYPEHPGQDRRAWYLGFFGNNLTAVIIDDGVDYFPTEEEKDKDEDICHFRRTTRSRIPASPPFYPTSWN